MAQHLLDRPPEVQFDQTVDPADHQHEILPSGTAVEVHSRFDDGWSDGFEIVERVGGGYRLKRLSDGTILPAVFADDDVRRTRTRKRGMWWY